MQANGLVIFGGSYYQVSYLISDDLNGRAAKREQYGNVIFAHANETAANLSRAVE